MDLRVPVNSNWESMDGPSEVNLGADLESIDGRFGVHSLTLWVVAVDLDKPLPCYAVPFVFWTVLFSIGT